MNAIAFSSSPGARAAGPDGAEDHPVLQAWLACGRGWLDQIARAMQSNGAHPARTVVLLPYAQLMPLAARLWAQRHPHGFAPRFETSQNWSRSLGGPSPGAGELSGDGALDLLSARAWLEGAGLAAHAEVAAPLLLQAAQQVGPVAAAMPPAQRLAWATRARALVLNGLEAPALALEAAVAQLAVTWAAHSSYLSDVLFDPRVQAGTDCVLVLPGFQEDGLLQALQAHWGERMQWLQPPADLSSSEMLSPVALHPTSDAQEEAQRAAACVLQHLQAGRSPVALVAIDRALTRRVRAMLASRALQVRDETGWKLSTSRAGAHLMVALRACAWNASSDTVLDWLKHAPVWDAPTVSRLELELRRQGERQWQAAQGALSAVTELGGVLEQVANWRQGLQRSRPLSAWLIALRELLGHSGQWTVLQDDVAGEAVLGALHLQAEAPSLPTDAPWASWRLTLSDFTHWVDQALEGASFKPLYPAQEQVVILPLAQMLGRPFAAVVVPGCDEVRLNPSLPPPGVWTNAQRVELGLPTREALEQALRLAWQHALSTPKVDLLWRHADEGGEPLQPSPLVQALMLQTRATPARDPRERREVTPKAQSRPAPCAPDLVPKRLSASAYSDLRHCPYRFFAQRMLGLKDQEELEGELDKRDFGLWLHTVLQAFHEQRLQQPHEDLAAQRTRLDAVAAQTTQALHLSEEEFLPFLAAWPQVREGYLAWLAGHEAQGLQFVQAEPWQEQGLGPLTLVGRLDRIDRTADGQLMVLDYKTESPGVTARRIKDPLEDTQLAFYAALLPQDTVRAAYVNVSEKEGSKTYEQPDVVEVRDALLQGLSHDLHRVAHGAALPALGDGEVCEFCAVRGLCRRDFWSAT